ncbi:MAG TPA: GNAT family protein [Bacillota bacterium]|nr:GNAT family protein [Bacillota bacterium]
MNTPGNQHRSLFLDMPTLETERLLLRKFELSDAADMFEYASDPEVTRYLTWDCHRSIDNSLGFIRYTLDRYQNDETGDWGIVLKKNRKFIGSCGFVWVDWNNSCGQIGYVLSRKYWGQGIVTEAVQCLIRFAFERLGLNRIEAVHFIPNQASGRVMQKAGMRYEGIERERIFAKGRYLDVKVYAIVKSDLEEIE